jgi:LuxR family maltose regulon positive regulatory protein
MLPAAVVVRLLVARQRGDLPAAMEEAERLLAALDVRDAAQPGTDDDLRALALVNLGVAEWYAIRLEDAERHLSRGVAMARCAGRPYLEVDGLAAWAAVAWAVATGPSPRGAELATQAVELAERHGWDRAPAVAVDRGATP